MANPGDVMARKLTAVGNRLTAAQSKALTEAGKAAKDVTLTEIRRDTGGDGVLSGVGKNGAKVGVRFDLTSQSTVAVKMTGGAAALLERGRNTAKPIKPKKRGKKQAIVTPWGPRANAKGSTAPGKHTFEHSFEKSKPRMATAIRRELVDAARAGMRS